MTIAHVTPSSGGQRLAWIGGSVHQIVLDGDATEQRLTAMRSTMPGATSSPVHVHDREDETVFVLEGSGVFWAGDQRWELSSGDTAFLPRGLPHTYTVTSETAELLTVCTPSGMENFFRHAGWDLRTPPPADWSVDLQALKEAADACGQRVLGPPLAPPDNMPDEYLD